MYVYKVSNTGIGEASTIHFRQSTVYIMCLICQYCTLMWEWLSEFKSSIAAMTLVPVLTRPSVDKTSEMTVFRSIYDLLIASIAKKFSACC